MRFVIRESPAQQINVFWGDDFASVLAVSGTNFTGAAYGSSPMYYLAFTQTAVAGDYIEVLAVKHAFQIRGVSSVSEGMFYFD